MLWSLASRQNKFTERCLVFCIALTLSILYVLVQSSFIFKYQSSEIKRKGLKVKNELAFSYSEEPHISNENYAKKLIVKKPLIYMYTSRLHTPLTYDESCEITRDPERFADSHAVVFHAKDLPVAADFAKLRSKPPFASQLWVYFNLESPENTRRVSRDEMLFNFTITPMQHSDLHHPYGYHAKRHGTSSISARRKTRFIAWCVSNCGSKLRNQYVHLMQMHVSVDVYGRCNKLFGTKSVCPLGSVECTELLASYKFYLAFENSLCLDYNTEKYWGALHRGNVPIVMAGSTDALIPNSYINVMDFRTVKELLEYLKFLDRNDDAYMEYFAWRKEYEIDFLPRDSFRNDIWLPQFCDILMNRDWSQTKVINISHFYSVENNCPHDTKSKIMEIVRKGV